MDGQTINSIYPVCGAEIRDGVIVVLRDCLLQDRARGKRKAITQFSKPSLSRLAYLVCETHCTFRSLLTLTYPVHFPIDGQQSKRQLRKMLTWLKRKYGGYSGLWFMEFQKRGAIHYHILLSLSAQNKPHQLEELAWQWVDIQDLKDWPYSRLNDRRLFRVRATALKVLQHSSTWQDIRLEDGAKRYALKYCLKTYQKTPAPFLRNVGRFWGGTTDCAPPMAARTIDTDEDDLRNWLRSQGHPVAEWEVLPRYIFLRK